MLMAASRSDSRMIVSVYSRRCAGVRRSLCSRRAKPRMEMIGVLNSCENVLTKSVCSSRHLVEAPDALGEVARVLARGDADAEVPLRDGARRRKELRHGAQIVPV